MTKLPMFKFVGSLMLVCGLFTLLVACDGMGVGMLARGILPVWCGFNATSFLWSCSTCAFADSMQTHSIVLQSARLETWKMSSVINMSSMFSSTLVKAERLQSHES